MSGRNIWKKRYMTVDELSSWGNSHSSFCQIYIMGLMCSDLDDDVNNGFISDGLPVAC